MNHQSSLNVALGIARDMVDQLERGTVTVLHYGRAERIESPGALPEKILTLELHHAALPLKKRKDSDKLAELRRQLSYAESEGGQYTLNAQEIEILLDALR